jgi:hypothetical protein
MGSIDQNNSYVFPLNAGESFTGLYTSTTNFSEILISVETDTTFQLTVNFSSNSVNVGLVKSYSVVAPSSGAFIYSLKPSQRYYQVILTNTGVDQTYLRLETILKSTIVYQEGGTGPAANVIITGPLNPSGWVEMVDKNNNYDGDGNLLVAGSLSISGTIDASITSPLVDGYVAISLQSIDSSYLTDGGLNVNIINPSLAITNSALTNLTFADSALLVSDTVVQTTLDTINTTSTNIYNILNSRGTQLLYDDPILADTNTTSINFSDKNIKLVSIYGNSSSNTILSLVFSSDNINFYKTQYSINAIANQDFGFSVSCNPSFLCINSSNAVPSKLTIFIDYS